MKQTSRNYAKNIWIIPQKVITSKDIRLMSEDELLDMDILK